MSDVYEHQWPDEQQTADGMAGIAAARAAHRKAVMENLTGKDTDDE